MFDVHRIKTSGGRFASDHARKAIAATGTTNRKNSLKNLITFALPVICRIENSMETHLDYERIILGIDPGTNNMGIGIIGIRKQKAEVIAMDVLDLTRLTDHHLKLKKIFETVLRNIDHFHPDELSIESAFFGKNVQSMLKLGRAQGVAIAAALYRDLPVFEYSPRKIKQSITGKGSASKEQVASMLQSILALKQLPELLDITDALAVALCHFYQKIPAGSAGSKSYTGWKAFISDNPGRISS